MSIAVITVNYRTPHMAVDCLRSVEAERAALPGLRAWVVDNDSGDDSLSVISGAIEREGWSSWATILPAGRNGGFAYGNNLGIRAAREAMPGLSSLVLINPDALFRPGALSSLVAFLEARPKAGIVGPSIVNASGSPETSAHAFPSPLGELEAMAKFGPLSALLRPWAVSPPMPASARRCDWVSGACMALKPAVLDSAGLLDEGFFLYFEETDLCRRAREAGWECWVLPEARIIHLEGASTGIGQRRKRRSRYWYESRRRFFAKHYGPAGLLAADALWALGRGSLLARRGLGLGGGDGAGPERMALDLLGGDARAFLTGSLGPRSLRSRGPSGAGRAGG